MRERSVSELLHSGLIILDKWPGPTSHDVTATVRNALGARKAGHSGTLDPGTSGVLPVALDNACKLIPALQRLDKEYVAVMRLHKDVSDAQLRQAIRKLTGDIRQVPPVKSAVARKERTRTVHSIELLDRMERNVCIRVRCQAGTYIRKLVDSIGKVLGSGAHMAELRRTAVGNFAESQAVRIQDVVDAYVFWKENGSEGIRNYILPAEAAVRHLGKIVIKDSAIASVLNGSPLYVQGVHECSSTLAEGELVALMSSEGELVALARAEDVTRKRGIAAKTDRVIMEKGAYEKRYA